MSSHVFKMISLILCLALLTVPSLAVRANALEPQTDQAHQALNQGRQLLKRGHADQALVQLQKALQLFTSANDASGIAASHNELGDLYLRQGQYSVALDHYQKAFDGFVNVKRPDVGNASSGVARVAGSEAAAGVNAAASIADDKFNANLMLAKIGDVNFKLGKISDALAAYSRMDVKQPESATSKVTRRFLPGWVAKLTGASRRDSKSNEANTKASINVPISIRVTTNTIARSAFGIRPQRKQSWPRVGEIRLPMLLRRKKPVRKSHRAFMI